MNYEYLGILVIVLAAIYILTRKKKTRVRGGSGKYNGPRVRDDKELK